MRSRILAIVSAIAAFCAPAGFGGGPVSQQSIEQLHGPTSSINPIATAAAAGLARQRALDGTLYAVIAPTFTGQTTSYIRLFNTRGMNGTPPAAITFIIMVVGSPSGTVYGTAQIQVPPLASPQYALSDILTAAGAGALTGGDTDYALYLQVQDTANNIGAYEHVIYNNANGFFEDVSVCDGAYAPGIDNGYANGGNDPTIFLQNVHSSILASYPSQIYIHDYGDDTTYQVTVVDARTGSVIGTVMLPVAANTTTSVPEAFFEQQLHWTPNANQQHVNLIFTDLSNPATAQAVISQFIFNQALAASVNMSVSCMAPSNGL